MLWIPRCSAMSRLSSILIFLNVIFPRYFFFTVSMIGRCARHGSHQGASKSIIVTPCWIDCLNFSSVNRMIAAILYATLGITLLLVSSVIRKAATQVIAALSDN